MKKDLINAYTNPEATVTGSNIGITLHLRGAEFNHEQWILKPKLGMMKDDKFVDYELLSDEERGFLDDEVFERLVRACVKGVERGIGIKLKDGSVEDLADLMVWQGGVLTKDSFKVLMRTLNQDSSLIGELYKFYAESSDTSKSVIVNQKKK